MRPEEKKKNYDNEFYTLYEEADKLLTPYLDYINKAKTIYCPCDSDDSNIVKWLKNNTNCKILYQYKNDFNSEVVREEMYKADIIITNPPFAMKQFRPFFEWLISNNKNFILWAPVNYMYFNDAYIFDYQKSHMHPYRRPNGDIKYAMSRVISNFPVKHNFIPKKQYEDITYLPITSLFYFDKDKYICIGKAKQRDKKDYCRIELKNKKED